MLLKYWDKMIYYKFFSLVGPSIHVALLYLNYAFAKCLSGMKRVLIDR